MFLTISIILSLQAALPQLPDLDKDGFMIVNPEEATGEVGTLSEKYWGNGWAILDFWAVWCAPCVAKIPALNLLANHLEKEGIKMVGMSIDEKTNGSPNPKIVENLLDSKPIEYPTAMIPRSFRKKINAAISKKDPSDTSHNMNVPMMVLVKGTSIHGVLSGKQLTSLEKKGQSYKELAAILHKVVMSAVSKTKSKKKSR